VLSTRPRAVFALAALLSATGCGSGGDEGPFADQISKVPETDAQTAATQSRLPVPLAVIVRSNDGQMMSRIKVRWRATPGAGTVSDSITVSDAQGRAQVDYIVGGTVGPQTVHAELAVNFVKYVTFTVNAGAGPNLASVEPAQFAGGDVVTVQGSGLGAAAVVEVNGAPARVASATATSLSVVVPVCLPAGAVTLRARVNGALSNTLSATFVAAATPLRLDVGDYASIDPAQREGCATFPAAGPGGAEYLVAPQAVTSAQGVTAGFRLLGDATAEATVAPAAALEAPTAAKAFHDFLRREEQAISRRPRPPQSAAPSAAAAMGAPIQVGDVRNFRVCSRVDCNLLQDFVQVRANARVVRDHVAVFVDQNVPASGFTDADLDALSRMFNDRMYDVATRAFGVEADVDANGVVSILLTPVVNGLTPRSQCEVAIVTGFFFAIDLDPTFTADLRANVGEVFYSLVPDPAGTVSCPLAKERLTRIISSTFIHEFQHMINYNQKVLVRRRPVEQVWLNEGLSHLAEELGALNLRESGDQQGYSDFVIGDLYDAYLYLRAPDSTFLAFPESTSGSLAERGASWLFLRWLVDKFGTDLPRRLSETPLAGADNITSATREPFAQLVSQWFLANYVSDLPGFSAPPRLTYDSWKFRTTFPALHQQLPGRFDRPFPLVPPAVSGEALAAEGMLRAGSGAYYRITQTAGQRGFTLRLTSSSGAPLATTVAPRLNVIRIR
jgi:hypothetical protein